MTPAEARGAWACADALMNWLNTLETAEVRKTDVYAWAMAYRPPEETNADDAG